MAHRPISFEAGQSVTIPGDRKRDCVSSHQSYVEFSSTSCNKLSTYWTNSGSNP